MRNVDILGVTQALVVVQVYRAPNDAAGQKVTSHFPRGQSGCCHSQRLAKLGFAGDFQAAVIASHNHIARRIKGPAALGVFCSAIGLDCFAGAHDPNSQLLGVVIEQTGAAAQKRNGQGNDGEFEGSCWVHSVLWLSTNSISLCVNRHKSSKLEKKWLTKRWLKKAWLLEVIECNICESYVDC